MLQLRKKRYKSAHKKFHLRDKIEINTFIFRNIYKKYLLKKNFFSLETFYKKHDNVLA